jgi:hypothetical protein
MVDVIVDEKPIAKLPADMDTVPDAVKKRAAAVDAMYKKPVESPAGQKDTPSPSKEVAPPPSETPPEALAPQAPAEAPPVIGSASVDQAPPPSSGDENAQTWKHQSLTWQGRYNASQKTIGELQEQMTQLGNELLQLQRAVTPERRQQAPPLPPQNYLTEQDVQNYGSELIDLTQRAAAHVVAPQLQRIEEENARLHERIVRESRRALDQAVELAVPDFREIDQNPRWHRWLLSVDLLSGRVRQQLLNEAISAANAPRVISFFRGFLQEEVATGHTEPAPIARQAAPPRAAAIDLTSIAAPGRARPAGGGDASLPPDKPIYTRAQIAQLYDQQRRGAYVGREAEWSRQEADIIAAGREGRIR